MMSFSSGLTPRAGFFSALLFCFFLPAAYASATKSPCSLVRQDISYKHPMMRGTFGPVLDFYKVSIAKMPEIHYATRAERIDFSGQAASIRFFYVDAPTMDQGGLVGCIDLRDQSGSMHRVRFSLGVNGNGGEPEVHAMFTRHLSKGVGDALLLVVGWETESYDMSGHLYDVYVYTVDRSDPAGWKLVEHGSLENRIDGGGGFEGTREGKRVTYPYKDERSLVKRLHDMGYLN